MLNKREGPTHSSIAKHFLACGCWWIWAACQYELNINEHHVAPHIFSPRSNHFGLVQTTNIPTNGVPFLSCLLPLIKCLPSMIQLLTSHRRGNGNLMFRPPQRWRFVKFFFCIRAVFWSAAGDDPQHSVLRCVTWRDVVFEPQKMCFQVKFDRPNLRFVKATAEMHQMKLTAHPTCSTIYSLASPRRSCRTIKDDQTTSPKITVTSFAL